MTEEQITYYEADCYEYNNSVVYDMDAEWQLGLGDDCVYENAKSESDMWHWRLILGFIPAKYEYGMSEVEVPAGWTFGYQMRYNLSFVDAATDPYVYDANNLLFPLTRQKHALRDDAYRAMVEYAETVRKRIALDPCLNQERVGRCQMCYRTFSMSGAGKTFMVSKLQPWLKEDDGVCKECYEY